MMLVRRAEIDKIYVRIANGEDLICVCSQLVFEILEHLHMFLNKMLVIRAGINKMLIRIANREDLICVCTVCLDLFHANFVCNCLLLIDFANSLYWTQIRLDKTLGLIWVHSA